MYLTCQYNGKDLYSNHWDLCTVEDGLEDRVIHCPIRVGRRRFVKELKIPNYLPKVTAFSAYNLFVSFCIDFCTWGEATSQNLWSRYVRHFVGITRHIVWSQKAKICGVIRGKIEPVRLRKCLYDYQLTGKAYLSDVTVTNIYESFAHRMAAKTSRHRYGKKLRHCHPVYSNSLSMWPQCFLRP